MRERSHRRTLILLLAGWLGAAAAHAGAAEAGRPINVVLVHGILDTGGRFDVLRRQLESDGCRCLAPSLRPNDGSSGVRDLSTKLSAAIDARFGRTAPFFIVGFSMGGLVTRDYVQNLAADRRRVRGVFLISTPNHGTLWAGVSPGANLRQLAPGSAFLRALNASGSAWERIPVFSYWTPLDLMIVPPTSSRWAVGETRMILCPVHPWMTRNLVVTTDVREKIRGLAALPPGGR